MSKVLFIQTAFIGDAILASGLIEKWHSKYPTHEVHLLVRKGNESLFMHHPHLSDLLIWDKKQAKYSGLLGLLSIIRKRKYDKVFNLQRFGATGLLAGFSGAREIIGFKKNPFAFLFTEAHPHNIGDGTHEIERNHSLIAKYTEGRAAKPMLYPGKADEQAVKPYLEKRFICLAPTSVWFTKQLPAAKWIFFLREVPEAFTVYLLGAPSDRHACDEIMHQSGRADVHNLAGKLTLLQSAALMKHAAMVYANDSAPMHLASAVNAPTTAVFCSTVPRFGFGPLAEEHHIIEAQAGLTCKPCGLHGKSACPLKHFKCGNTISVQEMKAVLNEK